MMIQGTLIGNNQLVVWIWALEKSEGVIDDAQISTGNISQ